MAFIVISPFKPLVKIYSWFTTDYNMKRVINNNVHYLLIIFIGFFKNLNIIALFPVKKRLGSLKRPYSNRRMEDMLQYPDVHHREVCQFIRYKVRPAKEVCKQILDHEF